MKFIKIMTIFMIALFLLTACGKASLEEESKETIKMVETTFKEKVKKVNKKSGDIQFYLPAGYEIKDESPNNIILKKGAKTFILFSNPQEDTSSEIVYKATVAQYENLDTNEKFTSPNKLGFLTISQLEDGLFELTIGVGETKITTQVKTKSLADDSKAMMEIVNSVEYSK
ncbi:MAG: hypothetical protein K6T88_04565 [Bacillus sp. (in: Bacteria)]|nr:hypothetical protein [Bacillus sp. (in: firmicutes)]